MRHHWPIIRSTRDWCSLHPAEWEVLVVRVDRVDQVAPAGPRAEAATAGVAEMLVQ